MARTEGTSFHGIAISWDGDGAAHGALRDVFAHFPRSHDSELHLELRAVERIDAAVAPEWIPWFFYGVIQTYRSDVENTTLIVGGGIRVSVDACHIIGDVSGEALAERRPLTMAALRVALLVALRSRSIFDLHAGAVRTPSGRGVLLVGDAGAGKTTSTVALVLAGCGYVADDTILLRRERSPVAASVVSIAALHLPRPFATSRTTLDAFPELSSLPTTRMHGGGKWEVEVGGVLGSPLLTLDPSVILLPQIVDADRSALAETSRADAFAALVSSSALVAVESMTRRDEHLDLLRDLANHAEVFELALGRDLLHAPLDTARAILDRVG